MPKKSAKAEYKNFSQGLITEASPLNFPPNAAQEIDNFVLNRNGTLQRRFGIDNEPGFTYRAAPIDSTQLASNPIKTYTWYNVNGVSGLTFLCVVFNTEVYFYDLSVLPLSTGYVGNISLSPLGGSGNRHTLTSVNGILVAANGTSKVGIVTYTNNQFVLTSTRLKTRDIWGVADPKSDADRYFRPTPATLTTAHLYNLYNQSWALPRRDSSAVACDPSFEYLNKNTFYPSDTEAVWEGLRYNQSVAGDGPHELFYPKVYQDTFGSRSTVAKGFFIIDLLDRGTSRSEEVAAHSAKYNTITPVALQTYVPPKDQTKGGPTTVASYAGRVWYGGFGGEIVDGDSRSPKLNNYVAFSQLVKNDSHINRVYQDGDPTSRDTNDLVDTDGGLIPISGAETIIKMVTLGSRLIVICSNGVWAIYGGSDFGFTPTNYKVVKVSTFGGLSPDSVIEDTGRIFYWALDGIYMISTDQMGELKADNITLATIQTMYEDIPLTSKQTVSGAYDSTGKRIRWLYNEGTPFTDTSVVKELVLDLALNAFYSNTIQNLSGFNVEPVALFRSLPFSTGTVNVPIISGGIPVVSNTIDVISNSVTNDVGVMSTRYVVMVIISGAPFFTFGYFHNSSFVDWQSVDLVGKDAPAYFVTGDITAEDSSVEKQVPYLTMHMVNTDKSLNLDYTVATPSSALVRGQWGWSTSYDSNKWSPQFQAYRPRSLRVPESAYDSIDNGFRLVTSKSKIRGRGKSFAMRVETEPSFDCQIVGWNINLNGNANT